VEETSDLEKKILELLNEKLMSVSQVANILGIRKDVAAGCLETLRQQGKLELFVVGKSNVYTVPRSVESRRTTRIIGIASGKGGVGKTVITINLSAALMEFGKKVIAIDADIKMSSLGLQLGMYHFPVTLNDVLRNNVDIFNSIYTHPSGIKMIPASLSAEETDVSNLKKVLNSSYFDDSILLLDSPPGLENTTIQALMSCNEVILITLPELPSLADLIKMKEKCDEVGAKPVGIIVNRYRKREKNQINLKEIETACELPVLGAIPEDDLIRKSIYKKEPAVFINPYSSSSIAFKKIAAKILGFEYNPPSLLSLRKLFWVLKR
jgi:septum site-determining protein MinD